MAVCGVEEGKHRSERLGAGALVMDRLVTLDDQVGRLMNSDHPPELKRVGISSLQDNELFVEVIEIREVLPSAESNPGSWALELQTSAESPTSLDAFEDAGTSPTGVDCAGLRHAPTAQPRPAAGVWRAVVRPERAVCPTVPALRRPAHLPCTRWPVGCRPDSQPSGWSAWSFPWVCTATTRRRWAGALRAAHPRQYRDPRGPSPGRRPRGRPGVVGQHRQVRRRRPDCRRTAALVRR